MTPIQVNAPFEKISINLVGSLPVTSNGNHYIVVAIDYLTKWAEARPITDASTSTIIPFLYEDIVMRHGFLKEILSDRGTTFINEIIKELMNKYQIKHRLSAPYHPQTNRLVERLNWILCTSLSKYVQLYKKDWDHYLPSVLFAYRTMKQSTTLFEPFQLVYGRQAITPLDIKLKDFDNLTFEEALVKRTCELIDKLETTWELALSNIQEEQLKQKERYDKK